MMVGAMDRQADALTMDGTPLTQGALVKAHVQMSILRGEKGTFNQMRLRSIGVILDVKGF